jgi:hypothetical protein
MDVDEEEEVDDLLVAAQFAAAETEALTAVDHLGPMVVHRPGGKAVAFTGLGGGMGEDDNCDDVAVGSASAAVPDAGAGAPAAAGDDDDDDDDDSDAEDGLGGDAERSQFLADVAAIVDADMDEDEDGDGKATAVPRTKNELEVWRSVLAVCNAVQMRACVCMCGWGPKHGPLPLLRRPPDGHRAAASPASYRRFLLPRPFAPCAMLRAPAFFCGTLPAIGCPVGRARRGPRGP